MGMLDKSKSAPKPKKRPLLTHVPGEVVIENQVDRSAILPQSEEPKASTTNETSKADTTSIRIATTTRDQLNSLVTMGEAQTVNDMIAQLVTARIESFTDDELAKFNMILKVARSRSQARKR